MPTGTPVQNNLFELWGLLHWLYPLMFTEATEKLFKTLSVLRKEHNERLSSPPLNKHAPRTKANVGFDVPPKEELTVFIPMSKAQRFWTYRRMNANESKMIFCGTIVKKEEDEVKRKDWELDSRREV